MSAGFMVYIQCVPQNSHVFEGDWVIEDEFDKGRVLVGGVALGASPGRA